jgi:hypothetical protein
MAIGGGDGGRTTAACTIDRKWKDSLLEARALKMPFGAYRRDMARRKDESRKKNKTSDWQKPPRNTLKARHRSETAAII